MAAPERILLFGDGDTGKTTAWLDIAKWAARTGSPAHFHVLDTDFSVERMMVSYPELASNTTIHTPYTWSDYMDFAKMVVKQVAPGDWVIVDFISTAWREVRDDFVEQVFNKEVQDYFLQVRKELRDGAKSLQAFDGWVDYSVINPRYFAWIKKLVLQNRFHVLATSPADPLSGGEYPEARQSLLRYGFKPRGQKDLFLQFHTILMTAKNGDTRTLLTTKDRERTRLEGQAFTSFTMDYLKDVAAWELA